MLCKQKSSLAWCRSPHLRSVKSRQDFLPRPPPCRDEHTINRSIQDVLQSHQVMKSYSFDVQQNYSHVIMVQSETPDILSISASSKLCLYRFSSVQHHLMGEDVLVLSKRQSKDSNAISRGRSTTDSTFQKIVFDSFSLYTGFVKGEVFAFP
jgi:hypothetical protein